MAARAQRAWVLGGGVAGLTAAFEIAARGVEVELLEARSRLGGRAFAFADPKMGRATDNGPHVILGCYDHFRALLRRLGTEHGFLTPRSLALSYRAAGGPLHRLKLGRAPVPLTMPPALLRLGVLPLGARLRALRGLLASRRRVPAGWTLEDWLEHKGQQGAPRAVLWQPLCLAIMNAEPREVAAALFLSTLQRAFGGSAARAAIWIPRAPWSTLLDEPAQQRLRDAGARVRLGQRVTGLEVEGDRVVAVAFGGVSRPVPGDTAVVSALPWHRLAAVLPEAHRGPTPGMAGRAIVNVAFDVSPGGGDAEGIPDDGPLCALVDGHPFQFVYRRPGDPPGRFTLIGSACETLEGRTVAQIEVEARNQLARWFPDRDVMGVARVRVTKEAAATLVADPETEALRPEPGPWPGVRNLWVCGDWTRTGLPSTLEGAAASAVRMVVALSGG